MDEKRIEQLMADIGNAHPVGGCVSIPKVDAIFLAVKADSATTLEARVADLERLLDESRKIVAEEYALLPASEERRTKRWAAEVRSILSHYSAPQSTP